MLLLSGWVAVALLATSLSQAWSAAPAEHPSVFEHVSDPSAPKDRSKIPAFSTTTKRPPVLRRGYGLPQGRFLAVFAAGISVLAVLFLVFRCIRLVHSSSLSFGAGGMRSLAVGGLESCDIFGERDDSGDAGAGPQSPPQTLNDLAKRQLEALEVSEEELPLLTPDELHSISRAKKDLKKVMDETEHCEQLISAAETMLATKTEELTKELQLLGFGHEETPPQVKSIQKALTAATDQRREAIESHAKMERLLRKMAWDPVQETRASLLLVDAYDVRNMSEAVAKALAAAERVLNPGKLFAQVPGGLQSLKLLKIADGIIAQVDQSIETFGNLELVLQDPQACARHMLAGKAVKVKAEKIFRQLTVLSMQNSAAMVAARVKKLNASLELVEYEATKNAALRDAIDSYTPSDDPPPVAPSDLSQEVLEKLCKEVEIQESEMLVASKMLIRALKADRTTEAGWKALQEKFVNGAAAYVMAQQTQLPATLDADKRNAFDVAMGMCEFSLRKVHEVLSPRLVRVLTEEEKHLAVATAALEEVREATRTSKMLTPAGDTVLAAMAECRNAMTSARKAREELMPLTAFHPTHVALHEPLIEIFKQLDLAQIAMVEAAVQHSAIWEERLMSKIESFKIMGKEDESSLKLSYLVQLAEDDLSRIMSLLETSPEFDSLEDKIREAKALVSAPQESRTPAEQRTGTLGRLASIFGRGKKKSERKKKE